MRSGPEVVIDIPAVRENARTLVEFCAARGIAVTGVTKVTCGMPLVGRAMLDGGVVGLGESRIENIKRLRRSGINAPIMLLRIPPLSGVDEIVANADISLNSELPIMRSLSEAAIRQGKIHKIILMVDLGDLREGIWPSDLMEITREVVALDGVRVVGIGTNLTCFGGVLPSRKNMGALVDYADRIEQSFGMALEIVSGGNSSSLPLLAEGGMPERINHLRLGESIILGRETARGTLWPGCRPDAFRLSAEVIELKKKPSVPVGETGMDAFGERHAFSDRGDILRAILNVGREDVVTDDLSAVDSGVTVLGASSDHLLIEVGPSARELHLGDKVEFDLDYGALLAAMTSPYVQKTPRMGGETVVKSDHILLLGNSPTFTQEILLDHLEEMGFDHEIVTTPISEGLIAEAVENNKLPLIGGEANRTVAALEGLSRTLHHAGLIVFSPRASLVLDGDENHRFLATVLGLTDEGATLYSVFSPENIVLVGLRDVTEGEAELIRERRVPVYTMEDIDLLGMREVMIQALRTVTTGTEGFLARLSTDVIGAEGEGLTFREAHLAMEMIAATSGMRAFDISGTPDKSWIDDRGLCNLVGSAFGKRIFER